MSAASHHPEYVAETGDAPRRRLSALDGLAPRCEVKGDS